MFEKACVAAEIGAVILNVSKELNDSIFLLEGKCSERELKIYRRAVGSVLGEIYTEILSPMYRAHPSLAPEGL